MGQKHSRDGTDAVVAKAETNSAPQPAPLLSEGLAPAAQPAPRFAGFGDDGARLRIITDGVAAAVSSALPPLPSPTADSGASSATVPGLTPPAFLLSPSLGAASSPSSPPVAARVPDEPTWFLLYNSDVHGRSFHRMLQLCCERGPTVVVIREGGAQRRVFGGFNTYSWLGVAARDKAARSRSAASHRATRLGADNDGAAAKAPANQSPQFFGDERCFLFTDTSAGTGERLGAREGWACIYRGRTSINSNFMYLFDSHPDDDRIGIGMGGQPGRHGWFIDRWLEGGHCRGATCTTFGNPALSEAENFVVDAVEVYAVDPLVVQAMLDERAAVEGGSDGGGGVAVPRRDGGVLRRGAETNCDKMLLEIHRDHQFYSDRVAEEEEENGADAGGVAGGASAKKSRSCIGSLYE